MIDIFSRKTLMTTNSPSLNENPANWRPRKSDQILDLEAAADLEIQNLFIKVEIFLEQIEVAFLSPSKIISTLIEE